MRGNALGTWLFYWGKVSTALLHKPLLKPSSPPHLPGLRHQALEVKLNEFIRKGLEALKGPCKSGSLLVPTSPPHPSAPLLLVLAPQKDAYCCYPHLTGDETEA